jgi:hypothetical protein
LVFGTGQDDVCGKSTRRAKFRSPRAAGMRCRLPIHPRHCERREAIHLAAQRKNGLLRCARNDAEAAPGDDNSGCLKIESENDAARATLGYRQ